MKHHEPSNPEQRLPWLAVWLGLLLASLATPASAATYTVTNVADSGAGSLREAMQQAMATPDDDEIGFVANGVITLASPLPALLDTGGALTIAGNGADTTAIDGAGLFRPFSGAGTTLVFGLRDLTVRNGRADVGHGGAISFNGATLAIDAVEFHGNGTAPGSGGAIFATATTVRIEDSAFHGNSAAGDGSAIRIDGGGDVDISNSTFLGDAGASARTIFIMGNTRTRLMNVTVDAAGGFIGIFQSAGGSISLSNCLLTGAQDADLWVGSSGTFDNAGSRGNVIGSASVSVAGGASWHSSNQIGVGDALLGAIGNHGGPTSTLPLLPGSPAIDAGIVVAATGSNLPTPANDQRGVLRTSNVDAGAFESRGFGLGAGSGGGQSTTVGTAFAAPLRVDVIANDSAEPVAGGVVRFTAPGSGASATFASPGASIGADGSAQTAVEANPVAGGPYIAQARIVSGIGTALATLDFPLTNLGDVCSGFAFPYTLSGVDNTARVAELRQAIDCANANATDDAIDLGGNTLVFSDAPYSNANGGTTLPFITSTIELRSGELERDAAAPPFRLLYVDAAGTLTVRAMHLRGGVASDEGGAILALGALTLRDSVFENNAAATRGGAVSAHQPVSVLASRFTGNTALEGAAIAGRSMLLAVNAQFHGNGDGSSRSVLWGDGYVALIGSLFADNRLPATGSSLMDFTVNVAVAEMRHVTIADNTVQGELLRRAGAGSVQVRNSIVWDNQFGSLGNVSPVYSVLPVSPPVNGNLDVPPGFVATPGNYRLAAGSPAIDAGENANSFGDVYDLDNDGDTTEFAPDLDLNPRPWDDPDVVDTGVGTAPLVDIGAYERQPASALPNLSVNDVSVTEGHSGTVDADFTISLSAPAPLGGVAFDIATFNGTATVADNDYAAQGLTSMFIAAGQTSTTFTVPVNGDTTFEPNETFFVNATNAVNAVIVDGQGTGTIVNDDADPCVAFPFAAPTHTYILAGNDNTARVAELRQAIECANANATDDVIDLAANTLTFTDGPYPSDFAPNEVTNNALPLVSKPLTLRTGVLQRDTGAATPRFRFIHVETNASLVLRTMTLRDGLDAEGGAIYNTGSLEVLDSAFFDNHSEDAASTREGGAIYSEGPSLRIRGSNFRGNVARQGGAVNSQAGTTEIRETRFELNRAVAGAAVFSRGAVVVIASHFLNNHATDGAGGALVNVGRADVLSSRFEGNDAGWDGGAISNGSNTTPGDLRVANTVFVGNSANNSNQFYNGSVFYNRRGSASFINVTATGQTDSATLALFYNQDASNPITVRNSVIWGNASAPVSAPAGTADIERSLVQGGYPDGVDILDLDPRFIDPANDDYTLDSASPAIDAGDNAFVVPDTFDADEDADLTEDGPDLAGNPRRHDDANIVDTGLGTAPLVDLGAYERQIDSAPAGITVTPTDGLVTTEAGVSATFTVVLDREPLADVTIPLSSDDTSEGTVSHADLTFTATNWNVAQTVTVTGVDDALADGNIAYTIATGPATSTDPNYNGVDAPDVSVTNTDNDSAGITVAPTGGLTTTEAGGSGSFSIALDSQPTADVAIPLSSSDTTEGSVSPASLTFTATNWNVAQIVTVTGVDDSEVDGDVAYVIVTATATSSDANYNGADASDVSVTNTDNDSAGITVAPTSGLTTTEAGDSATFTVVLNSQPSADVAIPLSSNDTTEGAVSSASLTFTATNWSIAQIVTVTGVDDNEVDGDVAYAIVTGAATSSDANYDGVDAPDVSVANTDNDSAGITVAPTAGLVTSEAGGTATFTVVLDSAPTSGVLIGLSSSDSTEGTVSPASLSFSATNWSVAQTVTVTGVDDSDVDGDIDYSIVTAVATSSDANYGGMDALDVSAANTDDDVAGADVMAYKSVVQAGTVQQPVIYDIQLVNLGSGDQVDDPVGDELVDVLPSELALRTATADAGTITLDVPGNTIRWNGALVAGASPVTIRIEADVAITQRMTIYNQAIIAYDADGDGSNDTPGLSTDPSQPGIDVPTAFEFAGGSVAPIEPIQVPVDDRLGQLFLLLTMLGAALVAMRRRGAGF